MTDTKSVRKIIYDALSTVCQNVYYERAIETPSYPFSVYSLSMMGETDGMITAETEINIVDRASDTSTAESLADSIQDKLDNLCTVQTVTGGTVSVRMNKAARNAVNEEDRLIVRRRLTFDTYIYMIGG